MTGIQCGTLKTLRIAWICFLVWIHKIRSYFRSLSSCIQSKYRKILTRNNSVFGQFSRSDRIGGALVISTLGKLNLFHAIEQIPQVLLMQNLFEQVWTGNISQEGDIDSISRFHFELILFLLYINDLPNAICNIAIYTDSLYCDMARLLIRKLLVVWSGVHFNPF